MVGSTANFSTEGVSSIFFSIIFSLDFDVEIIFVNWYKLQLSVEQFSLFQPNPATQFSSFLSGGQQPSLLFDIRQPFSGWIPYSTQPGVFTQISLQSSFDIFSLYV